MHCSAAAAITPSGVPPMPKRMSAPDSGQAVEMAPATSPSGISRMRDPTERTSAMMSAWRSRSRMTAVRSRTDAVLRLGQLPQVLGDGLLDGDDALAVGADGDLLHVDAGAGVEHRALGRDGDDGQGVAPAERGQRGAVDGVDGHVGERRLAVADPLAVVEHGRLVLLALADDDDPVHRHALQHDAHRLDRGAVGALLVATTHPARGGHRRRLGHPDELEGEVAIGSRLPRRHGRER